MALNTCVCQPFPSKLEVGSRIKNPGQEQTWPQLHSSDVLSCEPFYLCGGAQSWLWLVLHIHRHSNTCLPKVGPLDWSISFAGEALHVQITDEIRMQDKVWLG